MKAQEHKRRRLRQIILRALSHFSFTSNQRYIEPHRIYVGHEVVVPWELFRTHKTHPYLYMPNYVSYFLALFIIQKV